MAFRALEAAVRLRSYSQAALELNVTHSAVSHQIRRLEQELGVPLFQRRGNGMEPLPTAAKLAVSITAALALLERGIEEADSARTTEPLVLSVEQGFARRWLASRLAKVRDVVGRELDIRLENRLADFVGDGVDAAIRFGDANWPGFEVLPLFKVRLFPVCSPQFLALHTLAQPSDLYALPLLRHTHPLWSWPSWFRSLGLGPPPDRGMMFDDSSLMLDAAAEGLGVALARSNLVRGGLLSGRLVRPIPHEVECASGYFLVWRNDASKLPQVIQLRDWLLNECSAEGWFA
jgi:LysR family transcriptional regulator, glycine cleavage system transcriptional activator